ncbi:hypothetical protein EUTSA_v10015153mg [Eutrema salsugineum]|uniref:Uncharacterized protein n=1 Tax=Eutrema salsugineum TaxID=72664 RepID=V4LIL6_EUTSA|nr:hypothetical protein EUTSA_v10015153mg [Eutrema salsugineum]
MCGNNFFDAEAMRLLAIDLAEALVCLRLGIVFFAVVPNCCLTGTVRGPSLKAVGILSPFSGGRSGIVALDEASELELCRWNLSRG